MYSSRTPYPFVAQDGEYTLFTNVAEDMVLWVPPEIAMPIYVNADVYGDKLRLNFTSADGSVSFEATEGANSILSSDGILSGYVLWYPDGVVMLKSTIAGGDPQPWSNITVDMSVCRPYMYPPFSVVTADNRVVPGCVITIDAGDGIQKEVEKKSGIESARLDLITPYTYDDIYVSKIVFNNDGIKGTVEIDAANADVLITSDTTSDLRVVTNNGILFTEVSNDKL